MHTAAYGPNICIVRNITNSAQNHQPTELSHVSTGLSMFPKEKSTYRHVRIVIPKITPDNFYLRKLFGVTLGKMLVTWTSWRKKLRENVKMNAYGLGRQVDWTTHCVAYERPRSVMHLSVVPPSPVISKSTVKFLVDDRTKFITNISDAREDTLRKWVTARATSCSHAWPHYHTCDDHVLSPLILGVFSLARIWSLF